MILHSIGSDKLSLSDILKSHMSPTPKPTGEGARVYVRVSHERSAEKAISPETQRRTIEQYCNTQGYRILAWYVDLAKSAFREDEKRIEFYRMLDDAKADPQTSVVVVFKYDRFSRSEKAYAQQAELLRHGVRIESATEGYHDPDSETGAIMMPLTWGLNRLFSIKLRNTVIPNMKVNFEQRDPETGWAYKNGGWPMFGYRAHRVYIGKGRHGRDTHKLIWLLDDREHNGKPIWQWARTMLIDWRLGERVGYDTIAGRLTKAGVPTPTGRAAWSTATIQSLLGQWDRLYQFCGYAFWNREDCSRPGNRQTRDISEWIIVPNAHPAIITEQQCDLIWSMVSNLKRAKTTKKGELSRFALSGGILVCKHCGANYVGVKRNRLQYYVCGSHIYRRGAGCVDTAWYIPREQIESHVLEVLLRKIPKERTKLQVWVDEMNVEVEYQWRILEETRAERLEHIDSLRQQLQHLTETAANVGPVPELVERIQSTSTLLSRMEAIENMRRPDPIQIGELAELRQRLVEATNPAAVSLRQSLLKAFVTRIDVDAKSRTLEGHIIDPRSYFAGESAQNQPVASSAMFRRVAAPTGVEPVSRP